MFDSIYTLISSTIEQQLQNQFVTGGLVLGTMGFFIATLKDVPKQLASLFKRLFITTFVVDNRSVVFDWFVYWLDSHPYTKSSHLLTVTSSFDRMCDHSTERPTLLYTPALGLHIFFHKWRLFYVSREVDTNHIAATKMTNNQALERIVVNMIGRNKKVIINMFQESLTLTEKIANNTISIYSNIWGDSWKRIANKPKKTVESVILDENIIEMMINDMNVFNNTKDWYYSRGLPWRRGYLFYGPPGTGKTSTILTLASILDVGVFILDLNNQYMNDSYLLNLMNSCPKGSLLVLEDIDTIFKEREKSEEGNKLTFSGLLNAIDGVASQEGRIVIMTTNHVEKLDPALIRPGRCDLRIEMKNCSKYQLEKMWMKFFPQHDEMAKDFSNKLDEFVYSPARVQELFMKYRDDPVLCLSNCQEMKIP